MHEMLLLCIGLVLSVSLLVLLANKLRIAYPIFLVLAGLALGFIPAIPTISIDPNLVFLVILPPILFDAAYNSSWRALWRWRRIILVMAVGFVLLTATAVAFIACWLIPGFTLAEGFMLGAIISPPDAAAATAVLRYVRLPKGMVSILEGESLLNDATSLTLYSFALEAITTNNFVFHEALLSFLLVIVSGIAIGLVFGVIFYAIYRWLPTTSTLDIALSIVFPYLIYLTAEDLHSSGVLAVVTGGLFIAYQNHFIFGHSSRLRSRAVWRSAVFILNAVIFFLIGLQLPEISAGLYSDTLGHGLSIALIIAAAVILVRVFSAYFSSIFTRFASRFITVAQSRPGWRNPTVVGWAGLRGVVSPASALAIPLLLHGQPFPYRDLVLFITFVVIIVTLVGQGLILPSIVRIVKPEYFPDQKPDELQMLEMDTHLVNASITELENKYRRDIEHNPMLRNRYELLQLKKSLYEEAIDKKKKLTLSGILTRFKRVMIEVTEHQRTELHRFRHKDHYDDDVIAAIERRLDLEEERLETDDGD